MDSRFRGNDVIQVRYVTLTTTVIPAIAVIPAEAGIQVFGERRVPVDAGVTDTPVGIAPAAGRRSAVPAGWRGAGGSVGEGAGERFAPRLAFASTGPWGRVRSCRQPRSLRVGWGGRGVTDAGALRMARGSAAVALRLTDAPPGARAPRTGGAAASAASGREGVMDAPASGSMVQHPAAAPITA